MIMRRRFITVAYVIAIIFIYHCAVYIFKSPLKETTYPHKDIGPKIETTTATNFQFFIDEEIILSKAVPKTLNELQKSNNMTVKVILVWNRFFDNSFSNENLGGCHDYKCQITTDKSYLNVSEAVVFHSYTLTSADVPRERQAKQRFVFFVLESPQHATIGSQSLLNNDFFNWTMTYRTDSDIVCPYGYTIKRQQPSKLAAPVAVNKTKFAAWFVSNCAARSGRMQLVTALSKYMPIDVFGACGNMSCPKSDKAACNRMLENDYYFYLAFENSLCKDYVTEKFWSTARLNIIVVVLKRSVIANVAPPESFIAADDFKNVKEMAEYMWNLVRSPQKYTEQMRWKERYEIVFLDGIVHNVYERPVGFCDLCRKLWTEEGQHKSYHDFNQWWDTSAQCANDVVKNLLESENSINKTQPK